MWEAEPSVPGRSGGSSGLPFGTVAEVLPVGGLSSDGRSNVQAALKNVGPCNLSPIRSRNLASLRARSFGRRCEDRLK